MVSTLYPSAWSRFWHEPVRAERLAVTRILLGVALLADQLIQQLPYFATLYGPAGVSPAGLYDHIQLHGWHWTMVFFNTDDLTFLYTAFWLRVAVTVGLIVGWHTRLMTVLTWFLTLCFLNRNPILRRFADATLMAGLFLLMLSPSGCAFSIDSRVRRKGVRGGKGPATTPGWPVRLFQIQLCLIYLTTGLAKLVRGAGPFEGTWWEGTSIHYALNDVTMSRWSYAQLPLPLWLTALATYLTVWWEVLFPLLVVWPRTRKWALWFGVLLHLGIWLTIEVGWFSFYTLALYGVWIPGEFWDRWHREEHETQGPKNGTSFSK
jgi:uncharacterized membrane protein YphA (DoxX/SURF4 family)